MVYALDVFPGLNGDEAYQALLGKSWSQTNHGDLSISGRYPHLVLTSLIRVSVWCFGISIWALRLPAVLLTLLGLLVIYKISRKNMSTYSAGCVVLVFATHPLILGYARISWEPAGALLGAALVWFPFLASTPSMSNRWRWLLMILGGLLTGLAHPLYAINLFSIFAVGLWYKSADFPDLWKRWFRRCMVGIVLLPVLIMGGYLANTFGGYFLFRVWLNYITFTAEILSGVRIFQYVVGTPWSWIHTCQMISCFVFLSVAIWYMVQKDRHTLNKTVGVIIIAWAGFFVIQPWYPIGLGNSRFLLFLLCPVLFLIARGLVLFSPARTTILLGCYAMIGLGSFGWGYFGEGWRTENKAAEHAWWAGSDAQDPEPKVKAARWIQQHTHSSTAILVGSFWIEKPLQFFLQKRTHYYWHPLRKQYYPRAWKRFSWVIVDFIDAPGPAFLHTYFKQQQIPHIRHIIRSRRGNPQIVLLYHDHRVSQP